MTLSIAVRTPFGEIVAAADADRIVRVYLPGDEPDEDLEPARTPLLLRAEQELREYFAGTRRIFDLPLHPEGTEFQRRVWAELIRIPWGQVATYGEVARRLGLAGGARAVGQANHRNPLPLLIPCHRVVAAGGQLGGYGGGTELKRRLLALEGVTGFGV